MNFCEDNDILFQELEKILDSIRYPVSTDTEKELERALDGIQELEEENLALKNKFKRINEQLKCFSETLNIL